MKIVLKTIKQEIYEVEVSDENTTVAELKSLIEQKYEYDSEKIKLIYNSEILDNNRKLEDYKISDNSVLIIANLKIKLININKMPENNKSIINTDDLDLYNEQPNINSIPNMSNSNLNVNSNIIEEEEKFEADIKAENAVEYVASIMKVLCLKEPEKGKVFFKNLEQDNPQIMYIIKKNNIKFKQLLYSPVTEEDNKLFKKFYKGDLKEEANVNDNLEETNVRKLMEFGFDYRQSKDAYLSCDKNFELALNFLLENN